jgi:hypothetical protein
MLRRGLPIVVLLAWTAPAWAQQDPEVEHEDAVVEEIIFTEVENDVTPKPRWDPLLYGRISAGAGAIGGGDTINPGTGAMSVVSAGLTGKLTRGDLELSMPLTYSYRETYSTELTDMHGRGGLKALYKFNRRVKASAELGLGATWKPNWVDPFQPIMDGTEIIGYESTDRYSHWDRRASADLDIKPARHQRLHIGYDYVLGVYKHDPNFDPIYQPLHLTPWDRDSHKLDVEWRIRNESSMFRFGVRGERWKYFYIFSGDAKTGITHATSGGEPPNPLLEMRALKPRIESDFVVPHLPNVVVKARYELEMMQDAYKGYLSYIGHHPEIDVTWNLPMMAELIASAELYYRKYGRNSYDYEDGMDINHPPLAYGDRRIEKIAYLTLDFRMPVPLRWSAHWAGIAEAKLATRRTNYAYGIDWDYSNWLAWTGAEYRY